MCVCAYITLHYITLQYIHTCMHTYTRIYTYPHAVALHTYIHTKTPTFGKPACSTSPRRSRFDKPGTIKHTRIDHLF